MTAVCSVKNQYWGINAHLHSYWQAVGGWSDFHSAHIGDISKTLKARLLPMGYRKTFEEELYGLEFVDYRALPQRFQCYQLADQARIAARMLTVLAARQDGVDLETGPFAAKAMPLDEALATLAAWQPEQ